MNFTEALGALYKGKKSESLETRKPLWKGAKSKRS